MVELRSMRRWCIGSLANGLLAALALSGRAGESTDRLLAAL